jgi:hypothetical protein
MENYSSIFDEWLKEDFIEMVDEPEDGRAHHYLPHHPVFN